MVHARQAIASALCDPTLISRLKTGDPVRLNGSLFFFFFFFIILCAFETRWPRSALSDSLLVGCIWPSGNSRTPRASW